MKLNMKTSILFYCLLFITLACGETNHEQHPANHEMESREESVTQSIYYCSMHPDVQQNEPGSCPICGMDLVLKPTESNSKSMDNHSNEHKHSGEIEGDDSHSSNYNRATENSIFLASQKSRDLQLETDVVKLTSVELDFKLPGRVELDPRTSVRMSSYVEGRIDELLVNYAGAYVQTGDIVATIYSPEMINAQQELITLSDSTPLREGLLNSSRVKLQRLGMSDDDIKKVQSTGKIMDTIPLRAPSSGYVHELKVLPEQYMQRGESLFLINDHRQLWLVVEAYEHQLPYLKVGQKISWQLAQNTLSRHSSNGTYKPLTGTIEYISPEITMDTQTASVRLTIENASSNLRPNQLLSGHLLVPFSEKKQLTVPYSSVLWTGEKSFVYVNKEMDSGSFNELRQVILGPKTKDSIVILDGLNEGERVVSKGTFIVDAAAQLSNKPSMVQNQQFQYTTINSLDIDSLVNIYVELKNSLVVAEITQSTTYSKSMLTFIEEALKISSLKEYSRVLLEQLSNQVRLFSTASTIKDFRGYFIDLSTTMVELTKQYSLSDVRYVQFCPMANAGNGAYWISEDAEIRNPYYGDMMLRCGETIEEL